MTLLRSSFALLLAASAAAAQSPAPTPAPTTTQPPAPAAPGPATIQARSNLVILDVVVSDRSHKPIHNLKAADFTLRESNTPQTIRSIEEHTASTSAESIPKLPPGVVTNFSFAPSNGPVNILLIDRLNTPFTDQPYLNDQLVKFVKSMRPGTNLAIFGLNQQLVFLQGFTSDPTLLLAALQSKKSGPRSSPLLDPAVNEQSLASQMEQINAATAGGSGSTAIPPEVLANVQQFEAQEASQRIELRTRLTLEAMGTLARYLSGIPGRKNLVWFSGSFPITILPDATGDLPDPFVVVSDMQDEFRETTGLLSRAQVAVYPVDARGLQTSPAFDASQSGTRYATKPTNMTKDIAKYASDNAAEHITMNEMAHETGGQAFYNTNGLTEATARAIDLGSSYYTITYTPTDTDYNGKFRRIDVQTTHPGSSLDYRRGYYADPPSGGPKRRQLTTSAASPPTPQQQSIRTAMMRGAPGATQIIFKASVFPEGPPTDDAVAPGNKPLADAKGPYRRYLVSYAADIRNVSLHPLPGGRYEASMEFLSIVYDRYGAVLDTLGNTARITFDAAGIQSSLHNGLQFHQVVSVPARPETYLRIAVHDLLSDRIGATEVPIESVRNLPVVAASLPTATSPESAEPAVRTPPTLNTLPPR